MHGCEVVRVSDILKMYSEMADRLSRNEDNLVLMTAQKLKEKIQNYFGEIVGFWRPSHGSELVFNNNIEKEKLVQITVRENWQIESGKTKRLRRKQQKSREKSGRSYLKFQILTADK